MDALFRRAVPATVAGRKVKTLSHEDMLVVLAVHAGEGVWGGVIWLCDGAQIVNLAGLNWGWIVDQAKNLGIVRILSITLRLSGALLGAPLPPSVSSRLLDDPVSLGLADEIRMRIISRNSLHQESLAYLRLMMLLRVSKVARMKFQKSLAITTGPKDR